MSIQKLEIKGFRSLRDVQWEPGNLNLLIGPNGSGKSNLLRALALLRHSAAGQLPQEILRQGGIAPILWDGQTQELSWILKTDPLGGGRDRAREALTYRLQLKQIGRTSSYESSTNCLGTTTEWTLVKNIHPRSSWNETPHMPSHLTSRSVGL